MGIGVSIAPQILSWLSDQASSVFSLLSSHYLQGAVDLEQLRSIVSQHFQMTTNHRFDDQSHTTSSAQRNDTLNGSSDAETTDEEDYYSAVESLEAETRSSRSTAPYDGWKARFEKIREPAGYVAENWRRHIWRSNGKYYCNWCKKDIKGPQLHYDVVHCGIRFRCKVCASEFMSERRHNCSGQRIRRWREEELESLGADTNVDRSKYAIQHKLRKEGFALCIWCKQVHSGREEDHVCRLPCPCCEKHLGSWEDVRQHVGEEHLLRRRRTTKLSLKDEQLQTLIIEYENGIGAQKVAEILKTKHGIDRTPKSISDTWSRNRAFPLVSQYEGSSLPREKVYWTNEMDKALLEGGLRHKNQLLEYRTLVPQVRATVQQSQFELTPVHLKNRIRYLKKRWQRGSRVAQQDLCSQLFN